MVVSFLSLLLLLWALAAVAHRDGGLSVAYRAKPIVRDGTHHAIEHAGLDAILNLFDD
jgi:hypothetical protein